MKRDDRGMLDAGDRGRVRELVARCNLIGNADAPVLSGLAGEFARLVDAASDCADGIEQQEERTSIGFSYERGMTALIDAFRDYVPSHPGAWGYFRPDIVEPVHRNRVFSWAQCGGGIGVSNVVAPATRDLFPRFGVRSSMRVLVTDGPVLLAYVGVFRPDAAPFSLREARIFQELLGAPAFVTDRRSAIEEAHTLAARELGPHGHTTRDGGIRAAVRHGSDARWIVSVMKRGRLVDGFVVVARATTCAQRAQTCISESAWKWHLTPRQAKVLAMVCEGSSNRGIGARLGIAERTVELHVTAIIEKAQIESLAALIVPVLK